MKREKSDKILFAASSHLDLLPLFAQGPFSEVELQEYRHDRDWTDELPPPPRPGIWVWEFSPVGGGPDYWGEYDSPDIDHGEWRGPDYREWHFIRKGENPWPPVTNVVEETTIQESSFDDLFNRKSS